MSLPTKVKVAYNTVNDPNIFIEVASNVNVLPVTVLETFVPKVVKSFKAVLADAPAPVNEDA